MSQRREDLAMRRQLLVARSGEVRGQLVAQSAALVPVLDWGDRARAGVQWVRRHPGVVMVVSVAVLVARPRAVWRWGMRAWSVARFVRSARSRWAAWQQR